MFYAKANPFLVKWVKYFKEKSEERKMEDIIIENKGWIL